MAEGANARFSWDATASLEALGAAEIALWAWDPQTDRLHLTGAARALGLAPLTPECPSAALLALCAPQDRALLQDTLRPRAPGTEVSVRLRMREGPFLLWRGVWLEEGVRAAGVIAPEARFAAARRDALTGLLERRSFLAQAGDRLRSAGQYCLLVADLDRLRRLNEALGHERADMVLAALGSRLATAFSRGSLLARIGEDEFAVLTAAPVNVAAVRATLEQPLRVAGFDIYPSLSIGSIRVEGGDQAPDAAELLRRAELDLETAKTARRAPAASAVKAQDSDSLSRLALESDLRGAMSRGEFEPFYQPVVRLKTGAISGFEALVRWRHPRRGLMSPDDFLPLATEMGLMPELGAFMTVSAARQLAAWRSTHRDASDLTVSVNLSTGEIDRPGLKEDIARIIREAGLPPGALKLEITESDIMRDPDAAAVILHQLRIAGAGLALDDFGTGFSSLSYLTRLPFDVLKVDRYFVRTMGSNAGSAKIVRSVVNLGRDLMLEVVAEGVENRQMAEKLLEIGCDYGQGYGYAPALSAQEAEVYLNESYADGSAPVRARG